MPLNLSFKVEFRHIWGTKPVSRDRGVASAEDVSVEVFPI